MRALIVDHGSSNHLRMGEVPDPVPGPNQALVKVIGTSLNRGEVAFRAPGADDGTVLGWDASGIVLQAASEGGPEVDTPVLTIDERGGGWAELRAVGVEGMIPLPREADVVGLAALPVAALSALRALRSAGFILEKRILITGAAGGVGRFAVQLAAMAGAHVIAMARPQFHQELRRLGASETVTRPEEVDKSVFAAVDVVGGEMMAETYRLLEEPGGTLVSVGHAAAADEVFPRGTLMGSARTIRGFYLFSDMQGMLDDLGTLVGLVTTGRLDPQISWRGPWQRFEEAVTGLIRREIHGKVVLEVGQEDRQVSRVD